MTVKTLGSLFGRGLNFYGFDMPVGSNAEAAATVSHVERAARAIGLDPDANVWVTRFPYWVGVEVAGSTAELDAFRAIFDTVG
jgi:hypothetical protein